MKKLKWILALGSLSTISAPLVVVSCVNDSTTKETKEGDNSVPIVPSDQDGNTTGNDNSNSNPGTSDEKNSGSNADNASGSEESNNGSDENSASGENDGKTSEGSTTVKDKTVEEANALAKDKTLKISFKDSTKWWQLMNYVSEKKKLQYYYENGKQYFILTEASGKPQYIEIALPEGYNGEHLKFVDNTSTSENLVDDITSYEIFGKSEKQTLKITAKVYLMNNDNSAGALSSEVKEFYLSTPKDAPEKPVEINAADELNTSINISLVEGPKWWDLKNAIESNNGVTFVYKDKGLVFKNNKLLNVEGLEDNQFLVSRNQGQSGINKAINAKLSEDGNTVTFEYKIAIKNDDGNVISAKKYSKDVVKPADAGDEPTNNENESEESAAVEDNDADLKNANISVDLNLEQWNKMIKSVEDNKTIKFNQNSKKGDWGSIYDADVKGRKQLLQFSGLEYKTWFLVSKESGYENGKIKVSSNERYVIYFKLNDDKTQLTAEYKIWNNKTKVLSNKVHTITINKPTQ